MNSLRMVAIDKKIWEIFMINLQKFRFCFERLRDEINYFP